MHPAKSKADAARLICAALMWVLALFAAGGLLHAAWCAFTWRNFHFLDYGGYTNMIWNTGHGAPFRVLMDRSYLEMHLSFTLVLLGPLFRIWDHPFLLALVQWLMLLTGAIILAVTAFRAGLRWETVPAVAVFFVGYPFTQSTMLAEFHGVSFYFLLVPWLYAALRSGSGGAWIPLCLLLGVREDAFLAAVPITGYFAIKQKSTPSAIMAGLSLIYGLAAVFVLFPLINGVSLLEFRSGWIPGTSRSLLPEGVSTLWPRFRSLALVVLPCAPFLLRRGWVPVVSLAGVPLLAALCGTAPHQHGLKLHYPAAVMACLGVAIVEACSVRESRRERGALRAALPWQALYLIFVTIIMHLRLGFLPGGGQRTRVYAGVDPDGLRLLQAARHIPDRGTLICRENLSSFCANRGDLQVWELFEPGKHKFDLVFATLDELRGPGGGRLGKLLSDGTFGVRYFDGTAIVLQRGYDTGRNGEVLIGS